MASNEYSSSSQNQDYVRQPFTLTNFNQHPAVINNQQQSGNQIHLDQNKIPFSYYNGLALSYIVFTLMISLILLHKYCIKYLNYLLLKTPSQSLNILPIKVSRSNTNSLIRRISIAVQGPTRYQTYISETLIRICLITCITSCIWLSIQHNTCVLRLQSTQSPECLTNQISFIEWQPSYLSGIISAVFCSVFQLIYEFGSLRAYSSLVTKFQFYCENNSNNDNSSQPELMDNQEVNTQRIDNPNRENFDVQSQTTANQTQLSEREFLLSQNGRDISSFRKNQTDQNKGEALIPIDEDENDENCSPLKRKKQVIVGISPVKRFNQNDSPRSQEHESPTKGAIQVMKKSFSNESADDNDLVIRTIRIEQIANQDHDVKLIQNIDQNSQLLKTNNHNDNSNIKSKITNKSKANRLNLIPLLFGFMSCFAITSIVFALYYFVNLTPDNLIRIWKNICLAYGINLVFQMVIFVLKLVCSASLRNIALKSPEQIQIINNFWELYHEQRYTTKETSQVFDIESAQPQQNLEKLKVMYQMNIGETNVDFFLSSQDQAFQMKQIESDYESEEINDARVVPEKCQSSHPINVSITKIRQQSDSSKEQIETSPIKEQQNDDGNNNLVDDVLTPRLNTSKKNLVFSSSKKPQQFETPMNSQQDKSQILNRNYKDASFVSETLQDVNIPLQDISNFHSNNNNNHQHQHHHLQKVGFDKILLTPVSKYQQSNEEDNKSFDQKSIEAKIQQNVSNQEIQIVVGPAVKSRSQPPINIMKRIGKLAKGTYEKLIRSLSRSRNQKQDQEEMVKKDFQIQNVKSLQQNPELRPECQSAKHDSAGKYLTQNDDEEEEEQEEEFKDYIQQTLQPNKQKKVRDLHTINQMTIEDSPQAHDQSQRVRRLINNNDYNFKQRVTQAKRKKYNSPQKQSKVEQKVLASLTIFKELRSSIGEYGANSEFKENSTTRKRRLMLLDDAAVSSINFNRYGSAEFGSAIRGSAASGISRKVLQYSNLGSVCTPNKQDEDSSQKQDNLRFNNIESTVEIGAGQVNEDEDANTQVQQAQTNWHTQQSANKQEVNQQQNILNEVCDKSDISVQPKRDKSRKILVLHADSEIDSSSMRPSFYEQNKSQFSEFQSPKGPQTAFEKLVQAANKAIDNGRNGKRSVSVNQGFINGENLLKQNADFNFKQPSQNKQGDRSTSEPQQQLLETKQQQSKYSQNIYIQDTMQINPTIQVSSLSQNNTDDDADQEVSNLMRANQDNLNNNPESQVKVNLIPKYALQSNRFHKQNKENKIPLHFNELYMRNGQKQKLLTQQDPSTQETLNTKNTYQQSYDCYTKGNVEISNIAKQKNTNFQEQNLQDSFETLEKNDVNQQLKSSKKLNKSPNEVISEQRKKLEHFISVAKQLKAYKDILKIEGLLKELNETKQELPQDRMNQLKSLDLMTTPYNKSIQNLLKFENSQLKKHRDQQQNEDSVLNEQRKIQIKEENQIIQEGAQSEAYVNDEVLSGVQVMTQSTENVNQTVRKYQLNSLKRQIDQVQKKNQEDQRNKMQNGSQVLGPLATSYLEKNVQQSKGFSRQPYEINKLQRYYEQISKKNEQNQKSKSSLGYYKPDLIQFEKQLQVENISNHSQSKSSLRNQQITSEYINKLK